MKLFVFILLIIGSLSNVAYSQTPPIYTISSNNGVNYNISIISTATGQVTTINLLPEIGYVYGIFQVNGTGCKIITSSNFDINLYEYDIQRNKVQLSSYLDQQFYQFQLQPLYFNSTNGMMYLAGDNIRNNNVTIFSWNFFDHKFDFIMLPQQTAPGFLSSGAYDVVNGNYYVFFKDNELTYRIISYNIPNKLVLNNKIVEFKASPSYKTEINLFYANNQLYLVESIAQVSTTLYTVNNNTGILQSVYSINSHYITQDCSFVNNEQYVVFITSNTPGTSVYTTVDLNTYSVVSQTPPTTNFPFAYSMILYTESGSSSSSSKSSSSN